MHSTWNKLAWPVLQDLGKLSVEMHILPPADAVDIE